MDKARDIFVIFLLLSPELSISLLPWIDGYFLLTFFLIIFCKFQINKGYFKSFLLFISIFLLILFFQKYFHSDYYFIDTNLVAAKNRDIGTFGFFKIGEISLTILSLIKLLVKVFLGFALINYFSFYKFKSKSLERFIFLFFRVVIVYQVLFYAVYYLGFYNNLLSTFFAQKISVFSSVDLIHYRNGLPRFSTGFSEPSFLVSMSFFFFMLLPFIKKSKFNFIQKLTLILFPIILYLTTMSTSTILLIAYLPLIFYRSKRIIILVSTVIIILFHLLYITQYLTFITDLFQNEASVLQRLLRFTDLSTLKVNEIFFGAGLFEIYTQPPLFNLILQLGVVGVLLFCFIYRKNISFYCFLIFLIVLIITPQINSSYNFILFAIVLHINKLINKKNENFINHC